MAKVVVLKRKSRGFFKPPDVSVVRQAIYDVNDIIANTSLLLKAYYLDWFEKKKDDDKCLKIDSVLISQVCSVIQGATKIQQRKPRPPKALGDDLDPKEKERLQKLIDKKEEKKAEQRLMSKDVFDDVFTLNESHFGSSLIVKSELSLSHILAYSIANLETAYSNNVEAHFPKYPKRYIKCDLISKGLGSKDAGHVANKIKNFYFYEQINNDDPLDQEVLDLLNNHDPGRKYAKLFPKLEHLGKESNPRCYEIVANPWTYLERMVYINRLLETEFQSVEEKHRKLYSPLPFHSSFVPMHIRLDTSGLCQLLMDKDRISDFKKQYKALYNVDLNIKTKGDLLSKFEKVHGRKSNDRAEEGQYATELWAFLTNLRDCKQWKELKKLEIKGEKMVFDNSIVTDGVSISFQMINVSSFGRKEFVKPKKEKKETKCSDPDTNTVVETSTTIEDEKIMKKKLGGDPGKCDILALTDGYTTIRYTKGQRQHDTHQKIFQKVSLKRRKRHDLSTFESTVLNKCCKKTCFLNNFVNYCTLRESKKDDAKSVYRQVFFRQSKFTKYCKTKSSEAKFINTIKATFSSKNPRTEDPKYKAATSQMKENAEKDNVDLVIGWGNWGKNPNALKGCAPTPGVGIRRRFERVFAIKVIPEHGTSQQCPCCRKEKIMKKHKTDNYEIHHLLRCKNDDCMSRWWNRNVVGAFNILQRFIEEYAIQSCTLGDEANPRQLLKVASLGI